MADRERIVEVTAKVIFDTDLPNASEPFGTYQSDEFYRTLARGALAALEAAGYAIVRRTDTLPTFILEGPEGRSRPPRVTIEENECIHGYRRPHHRLHAWLRGLVPCSPQRRVLTPGEYVLVEKVDRNRPVGDDS